MSAPEPGMVDGSGRGPIAPRHRFDFQCYEGRSPALPIAARPTFVQQASPSIAFG